jgi:RNA polymerase sigma-70 factor, ECF subfamily
LHDARRAARLDSAGDIVTLEQQDRALWDRPEIEEGLGVLEVALRFGEAGPYQLQAAIVACHARATEAAGTNWREIARLYGALEQLLPSEVVTLNRAVAVAMADGPQKGLVLVDELERSGRLSSYHLLPATRADLLRRLGRHDEAAASYRQALELAGTEAERRFLLRRLEETAASL